METAWSKRPKDEVERSGNNQKWPEMIEKSFRGLFGSMRPWVRLPPLGPKTRHFQMKMAGFSCFFTKIKFQSRARKYSRRIFDFITGGMLRFTGSIPPFCLCGSGFAITPAALSLSRLTLPCNHWPCKKRSSRSCRAILGVGGQIP